MKSLLPALLLLGPLAAGAASKETDALALAQLSPRDAGTLVLAPVDSARLKVDDAILDGKPGVPLRYGVVQQVTDVHIDAHGSRGGEWSALADGRMKWQLDVHADGARTLEFAFARLRLPAGAELTLRAVSTKQRVATLHDGDNRADGRFNTVMVPGDEAQLELTLPADKRAFVSLELDKVVYGYRDPFGAIEMRKSGSCNIDVACAEADPWRQQIDSVAHYTFQSGGSSYVCTANLMATGNRAQDLASPRLSTAHHCVSTPAEAGSMVLYWGYESPTCRTPGSAASGTSLSRGTASRATQSGVSLLATLSGPDFTALQLAAPVPAAARAYYTGWDRSGTAPVATVGIHHPAGHEKRITFNDDPLTVAPSCIVEGTAADSHWIVSEYEAGTTEGGSSGSGLWDRNSKLLVGVLSGGDAACSNPAGFDCYGRLSAAWETTPAASQMRNWFDRSGTNPQTMAGMASCDAPSVTLESSAFATAPVAGANVTLTASISGGAAGARTLRWDVDGDGVYDRVGAGNSITLSYPNAQQVQVAVRVEDSTGCASVATRALDIAGPQLTATAAAPQQVCGDNDAVIEPGERWKIPVTLRNTGNAALGAGAHALFAPNAATTGTPPIGPNRAGYSAGTSAQGLCGYDFVDLTSGTHQVPALATVEIDNDYGPLDDARTVDDIALGGSGFRFYGQTYTRAVMSTNGYLSFSSDETGGDFSNDCAGGYNNGAAGPQLRVLHDDLVVSSLANAGLRYRYFASCPRTAESDRAQAQGCHVFQWSRMQLYSASGTAQGDFEFQAIAYERTGQVAYQYRTASPNSGATATIGISNIAGDDPLNAGCDSANAAPAQSAVCVFEAAALPSARSGVRLEAPTLAVGALAPSQQTTVEVPIALAPDASCGAPLAIDYLGSAAPSHFSLGDTAVLGTTVGSGGTCQVINTCPAAVPSIATRPGFYFSGARSGNGLANFVYGEVFGGVWYTALPDRSPTWYILNGDYRDHLGMMPILRFRNAAAPGGFDPRSEAVGRAWIAQVDADTVMQAWRLDGGKAGLELLDASPQPFTTPNHSQTWYSTSQSGWGLSIESLLLAPNTFLEFIVGYIYDDAGTARWVLGTDDSITGGSVDLFTYQPHCPACPRFEDWSAFTERPAGTLSRTYTGPVNATFDSAITLPVPLSGSWNRSNLPLTTIGAPAQQP